MIDTLIEMLVKSGTATCADGPRCLKVCDDCPIYEDNIKQTIEELKSLQKMKDSSHYECVKCGKDVHLKSVVCSDCKK